MAAQTDVAYSQLDAKGRIPLGKVMRDALGLEAGSTVAFVKVGEALMVVPQDNHLVELMNAATRVMDGAGISVQDLLEGLDEARNDVVVEHYGAAFLDDLERTAAKPNTDGTTK